eukprot:3828298-Prymnesium_polylepis.1
MEEKKRAAMEEKMRAAMEEKMRVMEVARSQKAQTQAKVNAEVCKVLDAYGVPWEVFQWEHL